ncbi:MAG: ammonium transporter, partial [Bryobacterales bacterium]|nr:ammonium transporter [Bryobacterales bacterium]
MSKLVLLLTVFAALGQAQTAAPDKFAALEAAVQSAQSAGDNAWMLTSAALVLMMTGPGLALFYGGLV